MMMSRRTIQLIALFVIGAITSTMTWCVLYANAIVISDEATTSISVTAATTAADVNVDVDAHTTTNNTTTTHVTYTDVDVDVVDTDYSRIQFFLRGSASPPSILTMTKTETATENTSNHHATAMATATITSDGRRLFLKYSSSSSSSGKHNSFTNEWNSLTPTEQVMSAAGLAIIFLVCWCVMTCLCDCCLRSCCFCGGRGGHYHRHYHRRNYAPVGRSSNDHCCRDSSNDRCSGMNCLWALCCFECCCRGNQDVDCCTLCVPLFCAECFCPQR